LVQAELQLLAQQMVMGVVIVISIIRVRFVAQAVQVARLSPVPVKLQLLQADPTQGMVVVPAVAAAEAKALE
jgi:hypothetical protein